MLDLKIGDTVVLPAMPKQGRWSSVHVMVTDINETHVAVKLDGTQLEVPKNEIARIKSQDILD